MRELLTLNDISAGYNGDVVLNGVSLSVHEHDFIGVIGPNGGGKTTLLKVILGLLNPYSGMVRFPDMPAGIRSIGYLPQGHTFDKQFPISVTDVVLSGLMGQRKLWKSVSPQDRMRALELLEMTGLEAFAQTPIGELSGGQKQKVFLCRAMVHKPKLLILDEPDTYVDKNFEGELYQMLKQLNEQVAIILVSHDVGIVSSVVKTIACVNGGLHYHASNRISEEVLKHYNCPVELVTHGAVPHRVLKTH
jgi:zinc transport system ATP-binding protein